MTAAGHETLVDAARAHEPDRHLAALLSPRPAWTDLIILAAWLGELRRIGTVVRDPALALVRLQWWRDAFAARAASVATGNPVCDAFHKMLPAHGLDASSIEGILDVHAADLDEPRPGAVSELSARATARDGAAFVIACRILGLDANRQISDLCHAAGRAYGLSRCLGAASPRMQPACVAAASRRALEETRTLYRTAPLGSFAALLPLALVEPYLRGVSKATDHHFVPSRITPLERVSRIWLAKQLRRF